MSRSIETLLQPIKWNDDGLIAAIAQDFQTKRILMLAWMDKVALIKTIETKKAHYYSRSRQKLWMKGESSGHIQLIHEIRLDCDADVVLLQVEQQQHIACHTGRESCFYRKWQDNHWQITDNIIKPSAEIYAETSTDE